MSDNETWYFTFGMGNINRNKIAKIRGTRSSAREVMFKHFDDNWAFQYNETDGEQLLKEYAYEVIVLE